MKKMQKHIYIFCFIALFTVPVVAQHTIINYTIAPWHDNKKAAASITLDDAISGQFTVALPLLNKYNIKATFFITARIMQQQSITWQMVNDAAAAGHEIGNHTIDHPYLRRMSPDSMVYQVDACNKLVDKNVASQKCLSLAYPFGDGGNATDSEQIVRTVISPYCIGARATRNNALTYNTYDFAKANDNYYKVNSDVIADSAAMAGLPAQLDETIAGGGWYVPCYHGIETGWIIVKKEIFEKHLQAFDERKKDLWIAPFGNVLKYHKERNCATLKVTSENKSSLTLALTDTLSNAELWNEPLTINLQQPGFTIKNIKQGDTLIPFAIKGDAVIFNAVPGKNVVITKG